MSEQISAEIDINHAGAEDLTRVPGLGAELAGRIVQARPFSSLDDLRRVRGIGAQSLDKMRPFLTCTAVSEEPAQTAFVEEPPAPAEAVSAGAGAEIAAAAEKAAPVEAGQVKAPQAPPVPPGRSAPAPAPSRPTSVTAGETYLRRSDASWWAAGLALAALVLAILFSLGILNLVNGTLTYAPAAQVRALDARAAELSAQIQAANSDLASLRARLDAMEGLSGRVADLERGSQALREDLQTVQARTEELEARSEELTRQVEELHKSSAKFQNFLDGLRNLLLSEATQ